MKKTSLFLLFTLILVLALSSNSFADWMYAHGKLINGPGNILYTVNGGALAYSSNVTNGVYNWMYTGYDNPIYMYPVSSIYGSTIDFYSELDYNNNAMRIHQCTMAITIK